MSSPPICLRPVESVRRLLLIARQCTHNGFPIVFDKQSLRSCDLSDDSGRGLSASSDALSCPAAGQKSQTTETSTSKHKSSEVTTELLVEELPSTTTASAPTVIVPIGNYIPHEIHESVVQTESSDAYRCELGDQHESNYDFLDRMLDIHPDVLRQQCLRQCTQAGINSEEVLSHLLTDSCINRFSRDALSGSSNSNSNSSKRDKEVIINISADNESRDEMNFEATEEGNLDRNEVLDSRWYNSEQPLAALDEDLTNLNEVQGTLCGLMLRSQIMVMLKHKVRKNA